MVRWQVIYDPPLPLTGYYELVAHIMQVEGVKAELFSPVVTTFHYEASQIGGMYLYFPESFPTKHQEILEAILHHYGSFQQNVL